MLWKQRLVKITQYLYSIWKNKDITLTTTIPIVKAMVFLATMYVCESWTIKKTEHGRIDAFKLWCWRRFLSVPWTAKRSNQSILKVNQPWIFIGRTDAGAEAPIPWPPDAKSQCTGKGLDAGKNWRQKEKRKYDFCLWNLRIKEILAV